MKTRMQPIDNVWSKLPRVVRDLSATCGKQVRPADGGPGDRARPTILEAVKDPLTHLVRNAVDHGIETRRKRVARRQAGRGRAVAPRLPRGRPGRHRDRRRRRRHRPGRIGAQGRRTRACSPRAQLGR